MINFNYKIVSNCLIMREFYDFQWFFFKFSNWVYIPSSKTCFNKSKLTSFFFGFKGEVKCCIIYYRAKFWLTKMVQFKYRNNGRFLLKFICLPASTLQVFNLKLATRRKKQRLSEKKDKLNYNFDQLIFRSCLK